MKRILALDGGGIRGVFTLEILLKIEELLREHLKQQDPAKAEKFVLRDHFDFLAGTSTGAIIATCLCWGMSVQRVMDLYLAEGRKMFEKVSWRTPTEKLAALYDPKPISDFLQRLFLEPDPKNPDPKTRKLVPATLASPMLRNGEKSNLLMVVVRNHTTGSAWPLTNNPKAKYNDPSRPDCNTQVPLWQLVRASTAAPALFPPETIKLGETEYVFVDGSVTPYSNPALIATLTAILPGYRINWPAGPDKIRVVSIGTIAFSSEVPIGDPRLRLGYLATRIPNAVLQSVAALLQSTGWQQDYLCRCLGDCIFAESMEGEKLDVEVGNLLFQNPEGAPPSRPSWFSYVRYNRTYKKKEMEQILENNPRLKRIDAIDAIPRLGDIGKEYAEKNVKLEHLI
jgi:predicted acylesterase/phospholipase RssA